MLRENWITAYQPVPRTHFVCPIFPKVQLSIPPIRVRPHFPTRYIVLFTAEASPRNVLNVLEKGRHLEQRTFSLSLPLSEINCHFIFIVYLSRQLLRCPLSPDNCLINQAFLAGANDGGPFSSPFYGAEKICWRAGLRDLDWSSWTDRFS